MYVYSKKLTFMAQRSGQTLARDDRYDFTRRPIDFPGKKNVLEIVHRGFSQGLPVHTRFPRFPRFSGT